MKIKSKNIVCIFFFFLITISVFGQERVMETEAREYFEFEAGEIVYLFGDQVNIRTLPFTKAEVLATLPVNTALTIVTLLPADDTPYLTLNGITAPWVKVQFGEKQVDGYVWAPLIAQYQIATPHFTYLFGVTKIEKEQLYGQLRALKYGKIWEQIDFPVIGDLAHYTYSRFYGNRGIQEIDNVLELGFGFDACGYVNGRLIFVIEKDAIAQIGTSTESADGGLVYASTEFIFPNEEEGREGKIIQNVEAGEFDDIGNGTITTKLTIWEYFNLKLKKATSW